MVQNVKTVGPNRYRETFGRFYEDFKVGDVYEHRPGRTISETDNTWFTLLTMNTHPMHFDAEYAKASEFGKCIVCSPLTVALMVGMSVTDVSQKAIANLGWTDIALTHPLYAGDTLTAESDARIGLAARGRHRHRQDHRLQPTWHRGLPLRAQDADRQARPQRRRPRQLLNRSA
jgi:acyl dehydratase